ncbi:DNA glycosylase [Xylaria sp. FL1042]|nr:DNA glycosylase [Xylaria sp. FL1042]
MGFHRCIEKSAAVDSGASDLSDDFMFGFDVEDDGDRTYLAEVAMRGIGHEDDIGAFMRLGLLRGMEEWDQAICCAEAMRKRGFCRDSLDGQDVLAFLARVYGVDVKTPPQRSPHLRLKRKLKRACGSLDAQIAVPAKKQRRAKNGKDSPYWVETRVPGRRQDGRSCKGLEAGEVAWKAPSRRMGTLEGAILPISTILRGNPGGDTGTLACKDPELTPIFLDDQVGSSGDVPSTGTPVFMNKSREEDDDNTREESLSKPDIPTIRVPHTSNPNIESAKTSSRQTEDKPHKPDRAPNNNSGNPPEPPPQTQTPKHQAKSPYFNNTPSPSPSLSTKSPKKKRAPRGTVSSLPFPRLDAPRFGLIQEELASDPFQLLIAVTFLVRTTGKAAIPVFRTLMDRYPTPAALAEAPVADLVERIRHLGLGSVRAATIQRFARLWVAEPPRAGVGYVVRGYCCADRKQLGQGQGQGHYHPRGTDLEDGVKKEGEGEGEGELHCGGSGGSGNSRGGGRDNDRDSEENTMAWEIGHMTQGPYALDSWRIFCRDVLRGEAEDWNGAGREGEFQPEWMRVLPRDKELRACLRWMWMREGWQWDPATGEKVVLPDELRRAVQEGRVAYDEDTGDLRILDE